MKKYTLIAVVGVCLFQAAFMLNAGETGVLTVSVDKKVAMKLTLPVKWTSRVWKNKTILIPPKKYPHIQLWYVSEKKNVEGTVSDIADLIKSEVLKFKIKTNEDIKVAGSSGKHLTGTGLEADDQDPSNADVYIFSVNSKIFILCVHGEGDEAAKLRTAVKNILSTVKSV